jgi:hypothetical protein
MAHPNEDLVREVLVYHVRDGKASEVWGYGTDPYAFDEFWS